MLPPSQMALCVVLAHSLLSALRHCSDVCVTVGTFWHLVLGTCTLAVYTLSSPLSGTAVLSVSPLVLFILFVTCWCFLVYFSTCTPCSLSPLRSQALQYSLRHLWYFLYFLLLVGTFWFNLFLVLVPFAHSLLSALRHCRTLCPLSVSPLVLVGTC